MVCSKVLEGQWYFPPAFWSSVFRRSSCPCVLYLCPTICKEGQMIWGYVSLLSLLCWMDFQVRVGGGAAGSYQTKVDFLSKLKKSFIRSTSIQVVILDLNWYENAFLKSTNKMSWVDLIRPLIVEHKITYHKRSFIRLKSLVFNPWINP